MALITYYHFDEHGYSINVFDPISGAEEASYQAGNNKNSSAPQDSVSPDSPNALSLDEIETMCLQTANEMNEEFEGIGLEFDESLAEELADTEYLHES